MVSYGWSQCVFGKGHMGSALIGSLQCYVFWQRDFGGIPVNICFIFPKVPGRTFFPKLSKFITFAAAPLNSVDPICPQPNCMFICT